MSKRQEVVKRVDSADQISFALAWVRQMTERALVAGAVVITLGRESKSREQEKKFHAMIEEIRLQGFRGYTDDGMKAVLVNQFALEMASQGSPLRHPGEKAWDWVNQAPVYVRPSTTKFRKREASGFIEFLYATGSEFGVQWSEKALAIYDEMRIAA